MGFQNVDRYSVPGLRVERRAGRGTVPARARGQGVNRTVISAVRGTAIIHRTVPSVHHLQAKPSANLLLQATGYLRLRHLKGGDSFNKSFHTHFPPSHTQVGDVVSYLAGCCCVSLDFE